MIDLLKQNFDIIENWSKKLIKESSDIVSPGSILKNIKTPEITRYDLNIPDIFLHEQIRHITYTILEPHSYVKTHTHDNSSYVSVKDNNYILVPWDGKRKYKTTHFVLETNNDAYFVFGDVKYTWKKYNFESLNTLFIPHYAENPGNTPIKFLYIDYYESSD